MAIHPVISNYDVVNDLLIYDGEAHCPWDGNALYKQQMIDFVTSFVYNNIQCDQTYIEEIYSDKTLLYSFDLLGRISTSNNGLKFSVYSDGTVNKNHIKFLIKLIVLSCCVDDII